MREAQTQLALEGNDTNVADGAFWRILLVDDDEDDLVLFRDLLAEKRQGRYELTWISTFQEAGQAIRTSNYDIILVDYSLGEGTGVDLIRQAVAQGCRAPFILVTGYGSYEIDLEAMQAGAVDYLNKNDLTGTLLERSIRYAIKQKRTEHALAEANAAIRQNRQELFEILESVSDGFLALDREWRYIYINRRAANDGNREPEELIGKVIWEEFPRLVNTPLWAFYHKVMQQREPAHFVYEGHSPEKHYTISVYPTAQGISVYWLDVTSQKQAEQALARSYERLACLIKVSSKVLAEKSVRGLLQTIVDSACELTHSRLGTCGHGFVNGEFKIGLTSRAADYQPCPPGSNFTVERGGVYKLLVDSVSSIRLTGADLVRHPAWHGLPEGHAPLNGLLGVRIVGSNNEPKGLIMVSDKAEGEFTAEDEALLVQLAALASLSLQHIEARQAAEQAAEDAQRSAEQAHRTAVEIEGERARLEALLQYMPAGVIIAEAPSGKMMLINQQVSDIWGSPFTPVEAIDQYGQFEGYHVGGARYQAGEWPLARSILHGEVVEGEEIIIRKGGGSFGNMLVNSVPICDSEGKITAGVMVCIDVTDQRRLEARHIEYTAQMEVQRRLLDHREMERLQIARDLHDGPVQDLISLMFSVQNIVAQSPESKVSQMLLELQSSTKTLVEELRTFFKELRPPTLVKFGLEKALHAHAEEFASKNPGLTIHLDLQEDHEKLPSGLRLALYRIYQESLNNIVRHAGAKEVNVRFGVEQDQIVLEIRDNGAGFAMPNDWVELARQGHLGLVGMKERAEAVGGILKVSSMRGKGTRVRVEVPWNDALQ